MWRYINPLHLGYILTLNTLTSGQGLDCEKVIWCRQSLPRIPRTDLWLLKFIELLLKFGPVNQFRSMSQIINSFNFRWDQPSEQSHESGQDLSFNFAFSCKTPFVTQYLAKKPNSSPTFPQSILIQNPSQSTINVHSEPVYCQYSFRTSLLLDPIEEDPKCILHWRYVWRWSISRACL